jgi:hypothetical protein
MGLDCPSATTFSYYLYIERDADLLILRRSDFSSWQRLAPGVWTFSKVRLQFGKMPINSQYPAYILRPHTNSLIRVAVGL